MPECSEITRGIFIGNVRSAVGNPYTGEFDLLDKYNIEVVISVLTEEEYIDFMVYEDDFTNREWYRLVADDDPSENISKFFYDVHIIIDKAQKEKKNIMIHCAASMSRSPTLVIAYLMIANHLTFDEAYRLVKRQHSLAEPNSGFVKQLKALETMLL